MTSLTKGLDEVIGYRWLAAAGVVVVTIVASAYLLGRVVSGSPTAAPSPSAARPAPVETVAAVAAPPPVARPVAQVNPITGPNRPPLPAEKTGPFGSRITSGTADVALTFDDGPDPNWTPQVLELLRRYQVRATFCLIGVNVVAFPQLVRDIVADGHTLCNHSWDHNMRLGFLPREAIRADLARTNEAIMAAAPGSRVSYYRQPGGNWASPVVAVARELGMTSLHWTVDPQDWRKPGAGSISGTVCAGTTAGAIVLMHDGGGDRRGTVAALRTILPNLVRRFRLTPLPPGVDPPRWHGRELPLLPGQT